MSVNRLPDADIQFLDNTGLPYAGGFLNFYASGTSTPLATYSDVALTIPNANPIVLDSAGRAGAVFLQNASYKVVLSDVNSAQIWTQDPVFASNWNTLAQFTTYTGNPNGFVAGISDPASAVWDRTNNILYVCTTTGSVSTTVWTAVNSPTTTSSSVVAPQGYLTPTSGTPVILTDVTSATSLVYTPYVGNLCPIYSGSAFVATAFAELTLTLTASHAASTIYDVFMFLNAGVATLATGPAWTSSTSNAGARGTGAGTTQLSRVNGLWTNAVQITGRNGATTYTISANQATFLGSIFIDTVAGQITLHRSYGQSRKWAIWNAYNRVPVILKVGDATASWIYQTTTFRPSDTSILNSMTVFSGLAEEMYDTIFTQRVAYINTGSVSAMNTGAIIGIGWSSTTTNSGTFGIANLVQLNLGGAVNYSLTLDTTLMSRYIAPPTLGVVTVTCLESSNQTASSQTFYGLEQSMLMTGQWRA